jgi:hypothetical protein
MITGPHTDRNGEDPPMPTPGFPPHTLDDGGPVWISDLAVADPNHALHVVRGLDPAEALRLLGAEPDAVRPVELPATRPDDWTSLPAAALGAHSAEDVLLAGRVGEWTFVYDAAGVTGGDEETEALSADGRKAATSVVTINLDTSFGYAVDGETVLSTSADDLDLAEDLPAMPEEVRAAFEAAGTFDAEHLDPGEPDYDITMRAACALAGLVCTTEDLRRLPLLGASLG